MNYKFLFFGLVFVLFFSIIVIAGIALDDPVPTNSYYYKDYSDEDLIERFHERVEKFGYKNVDRDSVLMREIENRVNEGNKELLGDVFGIDISNSGEANTINIYYNSDKKSWEIDSWVKYEGYRATDSLISGISIDSESLFKAGSELKISDRGYLSLNGADIRAARLKSYFTKDDQTSFLMSDERLHGKSVWGIEGLVDERRGHENDYANINVENLEEGTVLQLGGNVWFDTREQDEVLGYTHESGKEGIVERIGDGLFFKGEFFVPNNNVMIDGQFFVDSNKNSFELEMGTLDVMAMTGDLFSPSFNKIFSLNVDDGQGPLTFFSREKDPNFYDQYIQIPESQIGEIPIKDGIIIGNINQKIDVTLYGESRYLPLINIDSVLAGELLIKSEGSVFRVRPYNQFSFRGELSHFPIINYGPTSVNGEEGEIYFEESLIGTIIRE